VKKDTKFNILKFVGPIIHLELHKNFNGKNPPFSSSYNFINTTKNTFLSKENFSL